MITDRANVALTARVAQWADEYLTRTAWIIHCLERHNAGDWGDLDALDHAANTDALRRLDGRLLSRYAVPTELTDPIQNDDVLWIITDDLADTDPLTTVLWPSDY